MNIPNRIISTMLYLIITLSSCNNNSSVEIHSKNAEFSALEDEFADAVEIMFKNIGYSIPMDHKGLIKKSDHTNCQWHEMVKAKSLFLYISPISCWSCTKETIKIFNGCIDDSISVNYIIPNFDVQINEAFTDYLSLPADRTYSLSDSLRLPVEQLNHPFVFTIDDNYNITYIFPVIKNSQIVIESFINLLT